MDDVKDLGKRNVLGVLVDAVDYEAAVDKIIDAAEKRRPFSVTALAVHGIMTGVSDESHRYRLNRFDLVTPDGQPVRWALNLLHRTSLRQRVYGPTLILQVCEAAASKGLPIYLYGSRQEVVERLADNLRRRFPKLTVAGIEPSKFRAMTPGEREELADRIEASRAKITLVGLGCPRQEVFVYENRDLLQMPLLAVGAAFDYHSGTLKEPPLLAQRWGLQWAYRLLQEPRRLWRRYLLLNPTFLLLLVMQSIRIWRPNPSAAEPPAHELSYG